ncbi:bacteriocin-associated integral membrane family protein [Streptomyces parvus]|uniref:bacteriocin-associated integral membrane family protein n=1 Tax=Streptomyces parvus TaxID=66428 RepID=UPI003821482B
MLHRGIKFVHGVVLAYAAMVAFLFLRSLDGDWALGHTAVVWVTESGRSAAASEVYQVVDEFAQAKRVSVIREVPDLKEPYSKRHLFLSPGGEHSDWLRDGYPAFNRGYDNEVHPLHELGQRDPRGFYYVYGPNGAAASLVEELTGHGLTASVHHPLSVSELAPVYTGGALFRSLFVVALAVVTTTGAGVLLNARAYGVLRLNGLSFGRILLRDIRQLASVYLYAFPAIGCLALLALGLYNGLAWIGTFALLTAGVAAGLGLIAFAAHAAALRLIFQTDVLKSLKGELPARAATASTYAVRVPALLLALSITSAVAVTGQDVATRLANDGAYSEVGDTSRIALNGSLASDDALRDLDRNVGSWLRQADRNGQVVLAGHRDLQRSTPRAGLPEGELLIVNEAFLGAQDVLDTSGRPHRSSARSMDEIRLLIPQNLVRHAPRIAEFIPGLLNPSDPDSIDPQQIRTLPSANDQQIFTYNPRGQSHADATPGADQSLVRDPVIVAIPNGSPFLSNKGYTAYASQGSLVFPDPEDITTGIQQHELASYVTGMSPVNENAALKLRELTEDFRLQLFNLTIAVGVLLITGIGVCIVHCRKNSQAIFVRHISGWRFAAVHRPVLIAEGALALLLATWLPFQVWQQNQDLERYAALGVPPPRPPAEVSALDIGITSCLVCVEIIAVLIALVAFHRRIVKEGAANS